MEIKTKNELNKNDEIISRIETLNGESVEISNGSSNIFNIKINRKIHYVFCIYFGIYALLVLIVSNELRFHLSFFLGFSFIFFLIYLITNNEEFRFDKNKNVFMRVRMLFGLKIKFIYRIADITQLQVKKVNAWKEYEYEIHIILKTGKKIPFFSTSTKEEANDILIRIHKFLNYFNSKPILSIL